VHIVQRGETLFLISLRYDVPMSALIAANNISDPSRIYAGQRLVIPGTGGPSEAAQRHVVQRGETLADIARQYGISYWSLARANNITNPSLIYAGQVLLIAESASMPASQAGSTITYTVQRGDTLMKIAVRYGTTVADLLLLNNIANMDRILVGQQLIVPADGGAASPAPAPQPAAPTPATTAEGKQIVVNLTQQKAYAYENGVLLREFVVSTGLPATPTVTGDFAIYVKYRSQWMSGPGYSLPGVPWVMYFYKGYGLHGTYWHDNFGHPMSHGCVNMRTEDALWVYEWAPVGTPVHVTY
jgi:LysM repeat protein